MPFAIDGSNLGGTLGGREGARDPVAVLTLLRPWLRARTGRVVLVFDGPQRGDLAHRIGGLELRWSGRESADTVLLRLVSSRPKDWWVVTDDADLARRVRDAGARRLRIDELLRRVPANESENKKSSEAVDVEFWEKFFRGEVE